MPLKSSITQPLRLALAVLCASNVVAAATTTTATTTTTVAAVKPSSTFVTSISYSSPSTTPPSTLSTTTKTSSSSTTSASGPVATVGHIEVAAYCPYDVWCQWQTWDNNSRPWFRIDNHTVYGFPYMGKNYSHLLCGREPDAKLHTKLDWEYVSSDNPKDQPFSVIEYWTEGYDTWAVDPAPFVHEGTRAAVVAPASCPCEQDCLPDDNRCYYKRASFACGCGGKPTFRWDICTANMPTAASP